MSEFDLFQSIRIGDIDRFMMHINSDNLNSVNEYKQSLLHESISSKNIIVSDYLIKNRIDLNAADYNGQTALHYCAAHNTLDIAENVLNNGGLLNISDKYGNQPLWTAVFNAKSKNSYDMVKLFLRYTTDINHKNNNGRSPLDFAHQINDEELIKILCNS